ncbi:MAG: hypothetical protein R2854_03335 [Caldilineaceae bacterium]
MRRITARTTIRCRPSARWITPSPAQPTAWSSGWAATRWRAPPEPFAHAFAAEQEAGWAALGAPCG